jgi:hypothetical protein
LRTEDGGCSQLLRELYVYLISISPPLDCKAAAAYFSKLFGSCAAEALAESLFGFFYRNALIAPMKI